MLLERTPSFGRKTRAVGDAAEVGLVEYARVVLKVYVFNAASVEEM